MHVTIPLGCSLLLLGTDRRCNLLPNTEGKLITTEISKVADPADPGTNSKYAEMMNNIETMLRVMVAGEDGDGVEPTEVDYIQWEHKMAHGYWVDWTGPPRTPIRARLTDGTVSGFDRKLHSRNDIRRMSLLRLKRCHAHDHCHFSRVFAPLTSWYCKLRPITEGTNTAPYFVHGTTREASDLELMREEVHTAEFISHMRARTKQATKLGQLIELPTSAGFTSLTEVAARIATAALIDAAISVYQRCGALFFRHDFALRMVLDRTHSSRVSTTSHRFHHALRRNTADGLPPPSTHILQAINSGTNHLICH
jgi:hypothetical protein